MAVRAGAGRWFLINASPDLPRQIEDHFDLQPHHGAPRNSPIGGVLLTNADLDHVLGVLSLREGARLNLWATRVVRNTLDGCLGVTAILEPFCGSSWHEPPVGEFAPLLPAEEGGAGLSCRAIDLGGRPPPFARTAPPGQPHSVAYQFMDGQTGRRLLVAPDVCAFNDGLLEALHGSDAVLFDGTFWSGDELAAVKPSALRAEEMGHVTIKDGSLSWLRRLAARRKIFIHINNTNPVLALDSPERAAVEAAGVVIGWDGLEFEL